MKVVALYRDDDIAVLQINDISQVWKPVTIDASTATGACS
jgi:hypothetical protein